MQSAAVGAPRHYNLSSNATRRENAQEAARLDESIAYAWSDHPRFFTIEASDDFEEKIDRLIRRIEAAEQ